MSLFQPVFLPVIAGVFAASLPKGPIQGEWKVRPSVMLFLCGGGIALGFYVVGAASVQSLQDRVVEPLELRDSAQRVALVRYDSLLRSTTAATLPAVSSIV